MAMTWHNCFSGRRFGMDDDERGIRTEYERDCDRLSLIGCCLEWNKM